MATNNFDKLLTSVSKEIKDGNFKRHTLEISEVFESLVESNKGIKAGKKRGMSARESGVVGNLYKKMAIIAKVQAMDTKNMDTAKVAAGLNQRAEYWFRQRKEKVDYAKKLDAEGKYVPKELSERSKEALLNAYLGQVS